MIVLLEGPDGVGKTTLADSVEAIVGAKCFRIASGPPRQDRPVVDQLMESLEALPVGATGIVDRFHVGELVYGPIMRGKSRLSIDEACLVDMKLEGLGVALFHCTLKGTEHKDRLVHRDGGKPDEKSGAALGHADAIRVAFKNAIARLPGSWTTLEMQGYPTGLAQQVLASAALKDKFKSPIKGWMGPVDAFLTVMLPREFKDETNHLAWIISQFRTMGFLRDFAIAPFDADMSLTPDRTVLALGSAAAEAVSRHPVDVIEVKHRKDEHHYGTGKAPWYDEVKRHLQHSPRPQEAV